MSKCKEVILIKIHIPLYIYLVIHTIDDHFEFATEKINRRFPMKITDIQQAASNCCSALTSSVASAASWTGRTVQILGEKTVETVKTLGSAARNTANKAAAVGHAHLTKALLATKAFACSAWQITQSAGSRTWEASKALGNRSVDAAKVVGTKILCGANAAGCAIKCTSVKVARVAADGLSKTGRVLKDAATAGKNGMVQGFQSARVFLVTHQKETVVAGVAFAAGIAAFAAYQAYQADSDI